MKIEEFKKEFNRYEENRIRILFNRMDMDNEKNVDNIMFLMPIIEKIKYLNTQYRKDLLKQYNNGSLKIMADVSNLYKNVYNLIKDGANPNVVIDLLIETYIESITVLFSDLPEYFFTNYKSYAEHFNLPMPERRKDAQFIDLLKDLLEILVF